MVSAKADQSCGVTEHTLEQLAEKLENPKRKRLRFLDLDRFSLPPPPAISIPGQAVENILAFVTHGLFSAYSILLVYELSCTVICI